VPAAERAHRAGQLRVLFEQGLDGDSRGGQQLEYPSDLDVDIYQLADDLGKVDGAQRRSRQLGRERVLGTDAAMPRSSVTASCQACSL